ncbi:MAG: NYN domain-containing protein [Myxococcota bacterium]|nr:NYN domain-containing protein [Myxococcota bacterium]
MPEQNLCVLIDFENVAAGTEKEGLGRFDIRPVMRRLKDKGRILVTRAYGDWGRFAKFKQGLLQQGVQMMELTSFRGQDKNRADIALVVDAMELAFTRDYIDTFVLLSGDSDFTPLVMRLKELNRRVIGIGTRGSTSRLLIDSCDEFIFYRNIKRGQIDDSPPSRHERPGTDQSHRRPPRHQPPAEEPSSPHDSSGSPALTKYDAFALLVETVEGLQKEASGPLLAGLVKQSLQRKEPTFDESDYNFTGFTRFLESARDKGLLVLSRDDKAGGYRVELPDEPAKPLSPEADEPGLPALPGPAAMLRDVLITAGFNPLTHFMRHVVVHEFVDHVQERQARKKRNTLMYVHGDIARRCRKTDPYVPARYVSSVINALQAAGELLHSDGSPVRSNSAHFTISKDADELLLELRRFYLRLLMKAGHELSDAESLSMLLWGDAEHVREAGELCAWLVHAEAQRPESPDTPDDDSASADDEAAPDDAPSEGALVEGAEEDGGRRRGRRRSGRRRGRRSDQEDSRSSGDPDVVLALGLRLSPPENDGMLEAEALLGSPAPAPRKRAAQSSRRRRSGGRSQRPRRKPSAATEG